MFSLWFIVGCVNGRVLIRNPLPWNENRGRQNGNGLGQLQIFVQSLKTDSQTGPEAAARDSAKFMDKVSRISGDLSMKRYLPFAIIIAVAVLTMGAAAMLYRSKISVHPAPVAAPARAGQTAPAESRETHARGAPDAPVTLEIFGDFQCPSCATVSGVISKLEQDYGLRLRVIFREFPLAIHSHAVEAALAAEAAGLQGRFWEMHDMLYQYQTVWSKVSDVSRFFEAYAESLGLDVERFKMDSQSPAVRARVISEGETGVSRGVRNTPTIFVNNSEMRGAFTRENLRAAIETALVAKKKP